jgi:predicted nucleotidyltransferase
MNPILNNYIEICIMIYREEFIGSILKRDKELILGDVEKKPLFGEVRNDVKIIADFTEYSPLHNGHLHCMMEAKKQISDGIFTAIVPGPFERSGRGLPYVMTRKARADAAILVGADIVVEGPPMGIMGSGQYSLCLAKMFKSIDADYIPRGYKPFKEFDKILKRINQGFAVVPKPYKIVDLESKEILFDGKLDEDNYVIVSLSKSLKKIKFDFKNKFLFIKRVEGVSGTKIREAILNSNLKMVEDMLPLESIKILNREINHLRAPLNNIRDSKTILSRVNEDSMEDIGRLALIDNKTVNALLLNRPFKNLDEIQNLITQGFSRHYKQRILSSMEAGIFKDTIHKYIENYPSVIRILNYKNNEVLKEFKKRIPHRRLEICQ